MACQKNAHDFPSSTCGNMEGSISYLFALDWKLENLKSFIVHCTVYTSGVTFGEGGSFPPLPRNPGTIATDGEQPRPQPTIRINSSRKL